MAQYASLQVHHRLRVAKAPPRSWWEGRGAAHDIQGRVAERTRARRESLGETSCDESTYRRALSRAAMSPARPLTVNMAAMEAGVAAATARRIAFEAAEANGTPIRRSAVATPEERALCHRAILDRKRYGQTRARGVDELRTRVFDHQKLEKQRAKAKAAALAEMDDGVGCEPVSWEDKLNFMRESKVWEIVSGDP